MEGLTPNGLLFDPGVCLLIPRGQIHQLAQHGHPSPALAVREAIKTDGATVRLIVIIVVLACVAWLTGTILL